MPRFSLNPCVSAECYDEPNHWLDRTDAERCHYHEVDSNGAKIPNGDFIIKVPAI